MTITFCYCIFAMMRLSFWAIEFINRRKNMLRENLQKALKDSMLAKDTQRVGAIRLMIAGMKEKDVDARG